MACVVFEAIYQSHVSHTLCIFFIQGQVGEFLKIFKHNPSAVECKHSQYACKYLRPLLFMKTKYRLDKIQSDENVCFQSTRVYQRGYMYVNHA